MSNNKETKQTAVEWLESIIINKNGIQMSDYFKFTFQQAKEMEKEQQNQLSESWAKSREQTRKIAMHIGFSSGFMSGIECYEDYYEELNRTQLDEDEFTRNYIVDEFEKTHGGEK